MTNDDDLRAAAAKFAELDDGEQRLPAPPKEKLPRARSYLLAAVWGFEEMVKQRYVGVQFMFHLIAVAAVARAVPEALKTDGQLSAEHEALIAEWRARTKPDTTPVIDFLKTFRDLALHEGTLRSYAVRSSLRHGEGENEIIISRDYDVARYDEHGKRHDLLAELRWAFDWLDRELAEIEAHLPPRV